MKKHTPSERSEASGDSFITSTECLLRPKIVRFRVASKMKTVVIMSVVRSSFCFRCVLQLNPEDRSQA